MSRETVYGLLVVVGLMATSCGVGYFQASHRKAREAQAAMDQANQAHDSAITHAAQGAVYDAQAEAQKDQLQAATSEVERLRKDVARLRKAADGHVPNAPATPVEHEPDTTVPPVDLTPLVAKLDELVKAQDGQIDALQGSLVTMTLARDAWKRSCEEGGREALQLRASLAAREGLEKAALWKGRIQGLAVGTAIGYAGGRIR